MSAMVMSELETLDAADIGALVELEEILFPGDSPWTRQMFASEVAAGHHYVVHRDTEGLIDGYAGVALLGDDEAEVHTIGVRPDAQAGRGAVESTGRGLEDACRGRQRRGVDAQLARGPAAAR